MSDDWKDILASLTPSLSADSEPGVTENRRSPGCRRTATLFFERKGRGGKCVTIVGDITGLDDAEIGDLASDMRRALGAGGSSRGGEILIQGDRRDDIRRFLTDRGFCVKG